MILGSSRSLPTQHGCRNRRVQDQGSGPYRRSQRDQTGDLTVTIDGHPHALHVSEDDDKTPHEPTAREVAAFEKHRYPPIPKWDKTPSGRLTINITGGIPVRQTRFADTKTIDLADRLPVLLQELELRAADAEQRRLRREAEAAELRRQWEQARADATVAYREHHRARHLQTEADAWHQARRLTAYVDAMRVHVATLEDDARTAADEWVTWATHHAATLDPLTGTLTMPSDPQVTPQALEPFMGGLSVYGPRDR